MMKLSITCAAFLASGVFGLACNRTAPPAAAPLAGTPAAAEAAGGAFDPAAAPTAVAVAGGEPVRLIPGYVRPTGPVATVNGKPIPAEKFNAEFDRLVSAGTRIPSDRVQRIGRNIVQKLVDQELRDQAVAEHALTLTEDELEEAWKAFTSRFQDMSGRFDESAFQGELQRKRTSTAEMRRQIGTQRLQQKLVDKLGSVTMAEADLKAFYDSNPSAWVELASRDVRPLLVRVAPDGPDPERAQAETQARAAFDKLKKGADFEEVARDMGLPPMGPIHLVRNSNEPELETAAFALKVGDVSAPVKTRWGFYVLRLLEKNEQRVRPYPEVRDEIRHTLEARKRYLEDKRIVDDLRRKATIAESLPF
ncbi:MAG: hypothetical protein EXR79_05155 [Myxococcales bacterium]|nr:hypothetical protein [Myxococcales bacterium]